MKEWNRPQLLSLGVENTFEESGTYKKDKEDKEDNNIHYCHNKNLDGSDIGWHSNSACTNSRDNGCKGTDLCKWNEAHKSKCCGTGITQQVS